MIYQRDKLPIVCGGTGFYIDALVGRISLPDVAPDPVFRKSIQNLSAEKLFVHLKKIDLRRAKMLSSDSERNNRIRLIRALEIARANKSKKATTSDKAQYDILWIGLKPGDEELRKKIDLRLAYRLRHGMIAEAKRLHAEGISYKRMDALGLEYRSLARFLQKKITRAELETELKSDIWRYSRKQIGYWKRNKEISWYHPSDTDEIMEAVAAWR